MKVVINVHSASAYSKFNGLTFEVKEILSNLIAVSIDNRTVDFLYKEVVIVDFQKELKEAWEKAENDLNVHEKLHFLRNYKTLHKISDTSHF